MLANSIELHGSYFSLLSGGFNHYSVLNLNDNLTMTGLAVVEAGDVQTGEYGLTVHAVTPKGDVAGSVRPVFRIIKSGNILRINFSFSLNVRVTDYGMWAIVVRHGDRTLAQLPVAIQQGVPGATPMLSEK
jgi:hypothetical protein